jgi:hypothetical protein
MVNGGWGQSRGYLKRGALLWNASETTTPSAEPECLAEVGRAYELVAALPANSGRPEPLHLVGDLWAPIPVHRRRLKHPDLKVLRELRRLAS